MPESPIDIEWALEKLESWRSHGTSRQVSLSTGSQGFTLFLRDHDETWIYTFPDLSALLIEGLMAVGEGRLDLRWRGKPSEGEDTVKTGTGQNPENLQNFSTSP